MGSWAALALAVTGLAAAQFASGRPFTTLAWLAIAPLLASLVLPPRLTGLLAVWTVLLGLGLALGESGSASPLAGRLSVLVLLAAFAVANSVLRSAAQRRLGQARAVARVAQSALLREVPETVAAARLASRYLSASAEARVGGDVLEVVAGGPRPRWLVGDTRGKGLPAVRLASVAATSFRDACAQPGLPLAEVARVVDLSVTRAAGEEDFVTAVFAELDPDGWVQLVVCGHPPPLRLTAGGELESLAPAVFATPLGLHPELHLSTFRCARVTGCCSSPTGCWRPATGPASSSASPTTSRHCASPACRRLPTSSWTSFARIRAIAWTTTSPCCWSSSASPVPCPGLLRLPAGGGRVSMVSLERVRDELRSMFWLVPAACVAAAIGTAVGLIMLDQAVGQMSTGVLFPGPPPGARSFLSSITQAMIAFTGLVFSITIVVLQLTSGQFSPRVLRAFLRDRGIQFALGIFISTFVYAMVVQRAVTGSAGHHPFVPRIAVTGALILLLASVGLFILWYHRERSPARFPWPSAGWSGCRGFCLTCA